MGDPLLLLNRTIRHAAIFAPERVGAHLLALAARHAWLIAAIAVTAWWLAHRRPRIRAAGALAGAALLSAIGSGVALSGRQALAPYATGYCYGRPWDTVRREIGFLQDYAARRRPLLPAGAVPDRLDALAAPLPGCAALTGHETTAQLASALEQADCLLIDADYHPAALLLRLREPAMHTRLAAEFDEHALGTATGWLRRVDRRASTRDPVAILSRFLSAPWDARFGKTGILDPWLSAWLRGPPAMCGGVHIIDASALDQWPVMLSRAEEGLQEIGLEDLHLEDRR